MIQVLMTSLFRTAVLPALLVVSMAAAGVFWAGERGARAEAERLAVILERAHLEGQARQREALVDVARRGEAVAELLALRLARAEAINARRVESARTRAATHAADRRALEAMAEKHDVLEQSVPQELLDLVVGGAS